MFETPGSFCPDSVIFHVAFRGEGSGFVSLFPQSIIAWSLLELKSHSEQTAPLFLLFELWKSHSEAVWDYYSLASFSAGKINVNKRTKHSGVQTDVSVYALIFSASLMTYPHALLTLKQKGVVMNLWFFSVDFNNLDTFLR